MPVPTAPRVNTDDRRLNDMQDAVESVIRKQFATTPIAQGKMLKDIDLSTDATTFPHQLGRALQGWIVVRSNANAAVWDLQATNKRPDLQLVLKASAAVTVSLWVF